MPDGPKKPNDSNDKTDKPPDGSQAKRRESRNSEEDSDPSPAQDVALSRKGSISVWLVNEALTRMWISDRATQLPEGAYAIIRKRGEDPITIPKAPIAKLLVRKIAARLGIPESDWPESIK